MYKNRKSLNQDTKESGFTLIELLVVVLIIGILAAIAVPLFLNQRKSAVEASIKSDLKNLGVSMETSLIKNKGQYSGDIPVDFKGSKGNIFDMSPESGNTNVSAGSSGAQGLYPGRIGQYHNGGTPTRSTANGIITNSYQSLAVSIYGGSYWDYVPKDPIGIPTGSTFSGNITVRSSEDVCLYVRFEQRLKDVILGSLNGGNKCITAGEWTELSVTGTTTVDTDVVTLTAYSTHNPGSTFDYKDPIIALGSAINKDNIGISANQRYCVQSYNENDKTNIWHYSTLNGGVSKGAC